MRLILVRHGQTRSNLGRLLDTGRPGADLTDVGRGQAAALIEVLAAERIEAIYVSTLARTQQTAAPLSAALGLDVQIREGVREVSAGQLEMLGDDASVATYLDTVFAWSDGDLGLRMPGAESGAEVFARFDDVVTEVAELGVAAAVIVSHGAVIRSWTASRVGNVTTEYVARNPLANTGVVVVDGSPRDGWRALTWDGDVLADVVVAAAPAADRPMPHAPTRPDDLRLTGDEV